MLIYKQLIEIFETFNEELFEAVLGSKIEHALIVLQRKSNTHGYIAHDVFKQVASPRTIHEIGINPEFWGVKPRIFLLQNLVHQMMHVYQLQNGEVLKPGSHDEQFMDFMMAIGLMPSSNGLPDGKNLGGKKMYNYPLPDGAFIEVCNRLAKENKLFDWYELTENPKITPNTMVRDLYELRELVGDFVEPKLLEIPLLVSKGVDVKSLIDTLNIDQTTNQVAIDETKARVLIDRAIEEDKREEPKIYSPTLPAHSIKHTAEDYSAGANEKNIYETGPAAKSPFAVLESLKQGQDDSDSDHDDTQLEVEIRSEIFSSGGVSSDDEENIAENFHEPSIYGRNDDLDGDDAAARFLKQAIANKPEPKPAKADVEDKPVRIAQNINEVAALLGFESADGNKQPEKKKTKFKYTCSCGQLIHGGLGLSVICGKCQLYFMCETLDKESGVVEN